MPSINCPPMSKTIFTLKALYIDNHFLTSKWSSCLQRESHLSSIDFILNGIFSNFVNLSFNTITSLPDEIGNLINLEQLFLIDCEISAVPSTITNLTNLIALVLSDNQISSLPERIGDLSNLIGLSVNNNQLSYLPESIFNLSELNILNIKNNNFY